MDDRLVQRIRLFYNRTKHADRNPAEQRAYEAALQDIGRLAADAKRVAAALLRSKL
jgi:hypothetical protein